jgi:Putative zinc-finger
VRDHPDREQLAAWQAGELGEPDRARTADHLAGCGACATVVADIEHARHGLALLVDPELPAGFHERLLAAVERETPSPGRPVELARRRRGPWHQRPATWAAAAALLLFVVGAVGLVNLVDRSGSDTTAAAPGSRQEESGGGGGGEAAQAPSAAAPGGRLPVVMMAGEFSPKRLPEAFTADRGAGPGPLSNSGATRAAPQGATGERTDNQAKLTPDQQACVDRAVARAGGTDLRPSFFVETLYQGKPARVLVATVPSVPNQARYFVFPGGDCSVPPVAQGLGSATPR